MFALSRLLLMDELTGVQTGGDLMALTLPEAVCSDMLLHMFLFPTEYPVTVSVPDLELCHAFVWV